MRAGNLVKEGYPRGMIFERFAPEALDALERIGGRSGSIVRRWRWRREVLRLCSPCACECAGVE